MKGFSENLVEAAKDLRYLLARGYNREGAVRFVGDRHGLGKDARLLLYRSVYDAETGEAHRRKVVSVQVVEGRTLAVDGYNVLITVESLLRGLPVFLCDDGVVRDMSMVSRKYKLTETTVEALNLILPELKLWRPRGVYWFLDAPIPRSGELAGLIRKELQAHSLEGEAVAVKTADKATVLKGEVVASSDCVIMDKAYRVVDIPRHKAQKLGVAPHTPQG